MTSIDHDEVRTRARDGAPEHYLAATLAPASLRADLMAIAAFVAEVARVPASVKEPMMGEVRLQWWRDALAGEADTGHAIADAIRAARARHALPVALFDAQTEARAFDLYDDPMPDAAALRGYFDRTEGAPLALALAVHGAKVPTALVDHAGRALGATRLLATLPHWLSRGRLPLPLAWLTDTGCEPESLLRGEMSPAVQRVVDRLLTELEADRTAARRLAADLHRPLRTALLPLATISPYLTAIRSRERDLLRMPVEITPLARICWIARAHWLGL